MIDETQLTLYDLIVYTYKIGCAKYLYLVVEPLNVESDEVLMVLDTKGDILPFNESIRQHCKICRYRTDDWYKEYAAFRRELDSHAKALSRSMRNVYKQLKLVDSQEQ